MSELLGRNFLRALFHAGEQMRLGDDGLPEAALSALVDAAEVLAAGPGQAVIGLVDGAFYLDGTMLANASTEFHTLMKSMARRKVESITVRRGAARQDLADLARLVAGLSADLPAEGTVAVNDAALAPSELETRPMSGLRQRYADSLDTLRGVSATRSLELEGVLDVVDGFIAGGAAEARASLLMATVENHDEITYYHSVNVCLLAMALGRFIGLDKEQTRMLGVGALLHDIGKVVVEDVAQQRPGRLSNEDWAQIRLHPQEGALAIMAASGPGQEVAAAIALEHHVRVDGGGYPDLDGRRPTLYGRLVAIVDAYDAITSHRPYRPARTPNEALRILLADAGKAHDADLLRLFIEMMGHYPPGSLLRVSGGDLVMVVPSEDAGIAAVVVRDGDGIRVEDLERTTVTQDDIVAQLLPDEAGVDPGSLLEAVEQSEQALR